MGRCIFHLGATPTHQLAAAKESVARRYHTFGEPIKDDPATALIGEVYRTSGHVAWLGAEVAALDSATGSEASALLRLYQHEREHLVRTCKSALDAGIAERFVRIAERQGQIIASILVSVLGELSLSAEQLDRGRVLMAAALARAGGMGE